MDMTEMGMNGPQLQFLNEPCAVLFEGGLALHFLCHILTRHLSWRQQESSKI